MLTLLAICSVIGSEILPIVQSLEPYRFFEEGPCSRIRSEPLQNLNRKFLDSLRYIQEGNRYHIYRQASPYSQHDNLLEDDLIHEFCFERNVTTESESGVGSIIGFGRVLYTFQIRVSEDQPGVYFEATPRGGLPSWDVARHYITLTDNRSYAVEVTCWTGSGQVGWVLLTKTPYIDEATRTFAMDHASHMGFDSRNFIYLLHDKCGMEEQRNNLRSQAGDSNQYLRRHPSDTRIGVPYQSQYLSVGLAASPGNWPSRPMNINYNNNYRSYQQWRYRQQYK